MVQQDSFEKTRLNKFHGYVIKGEGEITSTSLKVVTVDNKKVIVIPQKNQILIYPIQNFPILVPALIGVLGIAGVISSTFLVKEVKDASVKFYGLIGLTTISLLILKWKKIL